MKDLLCTKTNWINQGKNPSTMADHRDGEGNEKLSTNEGVPFRDPASKAYVIIHKMQMLLPWREERLSHKAVSLPLLMINKASCC